jgi:TP901 family phage tail tape measure protein
VATVANLYIRISASATEFEKTLKAAEAQFNKSGAKWQSIGASLTKGITLPLAAAGIGIFKIAKDFDTAFANVRKTVDGSEKDFDRLSAGIRDMAKGMPQSAADLSNIAAIGGQFGVSKEGLIGFTQAVADLGVAVDGISAEDAAAGLAQIGKLTKTSEQDFGRLASSLVELGNKGNSTEAVILDMATRLAGAGADIGLTAAEIFGVGAALANLGLKAEHGGTAFSKVFSKMNLAVAQGGKELQDFANIATGGDTAAFSEMFKSKPIEAVLGFVEGLGKIKEQGGSVTLVLSEMGIKQALLSDAIRRTAGASAEMRTQVGLSNAAFQAGNAHTEEARKKYETIDNQLRIVKNRIFDMAISLRDDLKAALAASLPYFEPLIAGAEKLVHAFQALPPVVKVSVVGLLGMAAAAGPIAYVVGTIMKAYAALAGFVRLTGVVSLIGRIALGFKEMVLAASGIQGPWVTTLGYLGNTLRTLAPIASGIAAPFAAVIAVVGSLILVVKELTGSWTTAFTIILPPIGMLMKAWQDLTSSLGDSGTIFGTIWQILQDIGTVIGNMVMPVVQALGGVLVSIGSAVKDALGGAVAWVASKVEFLKPPIQWLIDKVSWLLSKLPSLPSLGDIENFTGAMAGRSPKMPEVKGAAPKLAIAAPLGPVMDLDQAMALLDTTTQNTAKSFESFGNKGADAAKKVKKELLDASKVISTLDPNYLSTGFTGAGGLGSAMQGSLGGLMDKLKNTLPSGNSLRDAANSVMLGGAPMVDGNGAAIRQALQDSIDENAAAVAESVRSAFQYFAGALSPALAGALGGILNAFEKAIKSGKLGGFFGSKKFAGGLDAAMSGFGSGYGLGSEFGTGAGMLGGAASGALAGSAFGPIGAAIGGLAGLVGGIFGGRKKKKEEQAKMTEARNQLLEQFGGMENLRDVAERAGVSVEKLFSTTKAKEFKAEFEKVTAAIEEYQQKIEGIVTGIDKVMSEGGIIGADLWKEALANLDAEEVKAKLIEVFDASVDKSAEGFNKIAQNFELIKAPLANIGVLADAAFGGLLANGASVVEAINQLGPGLQHIQEVLAKTGQTPTGPLADILNYQKVVEANAGIFELLSGVDDMLVGLANSGLLTQTSFSALGQTITQAFTQLTANGVAGTTALQLMQPQLQKLWELQKQFGFAVDSNTQSLLTQAEQQGIVGAQMQSTDQKILDVLIAIGTALGATIPQALLGLPPVAEQAAAGIGAAFEPGKITPKFQAIADAAKGALDQIPTQIPMELRMKLRNETGIRLDGINQAISAGIRIQPFAAGGVVTRPTMGLVGEAGPEAIIPLDEFNMNRGGLTIERVYGTVDRAFLKSIARTVGAGGDVKTAWQGALK